MDGPVRVGVVDDHPSILAALSAAIDAEPDLVLAGTGRTLESRRLAGPIRLVGRTPAKASQNLV